MYEKQIWKDRSVEKPLTYLVTNNEDGSITLIPNEGEIYSEGSKINATRMNNIENGIETIEQNLVNCGIGTVSKNIGGKDLDTICGTKSGFYVGSNLTHAPSNSNANFFVIHMALNETYQKQIATSVNANTLYIRTRNSNGWNDWRQL